MEGEFIVESMGRCFICLNEILSENHSPTSEPPLPSPIFSLENLARYLKLDMSKVLDRNQFIPQYLVEKVTNSKLKGELCENCFDLIEKFSGLYLKWIKSGMELISSLKLIQDKLQAAEELGKIEELKEISESMIGSGGNGEWKGKLDILEVLRTETIQKCSRKLSSSRPRVKVQNLNMDQVTSEKHQLKANSSPVKDEQFTLSHSDCEDLYFGDAKRESPFQNSAHSDEDFDDFDNQNSDSSETGNSRESRGVLIAIASVKTEAGTRVGDVKCAINAQSQNTRGKDSKLAGVPVPVGKAERILDKKSGKVRFKCKLCSTEFSKNFNFQTHYNNIHLKLKYRCSVCGKEFTQRANHHRHYNKAHR